MSSTSKGLSSVDVRLLKIYGKGSREIVAQLLESSERSANDVFKDGQLSATPLLTACRNLNKEVVQELLERGADPNFAGLTGFTPLMAVALASSEKTDPDAVKCAKLLKESGANFKQKDAFMNRTLLTRAIEKRAEGFAKFLVESGVDLNERDGEGETPFNFAVSTWQEGLAKFLVDHGANPYLNNSNGKSSVDIAALKVMEGNKQAMNFVLENRLKYNQKKVKEDDVGDQGMTGDVNPINLSGQEQEVLEEGKMESVNLQANTLAKPVTEDTSKKPTKRKVVIKKKTERQPRRASKSCAMPMITSAQAVISDKSDDLNSPCVNEAPKTLPSEIFEQLQESLDSVVSGISEMHVSSPCSSTPEDFNIPSEKNQKSEESDDKKYVWAILGSALLGFSLFCYFRYLNRFKN